MTESLQIALIVSIAPTIAGIASVITSLRNRKKLDHVHADLNGRLAELLKVARAEARAEGRAEGVESERVREKGGV